jgi:hypothetical protein
VSEFGKIMKYYLYKLFVNDYVQEQEYFPCQYPNLAKDGKENVIVLWFEVLKGIIYITTIISAAKEPL